MVREEEEEEEATGKDVLLPVGRVSLMEGVDFDGRGCAGMVLLIWGLVVNSHCGVKCLHNQELNVLF